jgi:hypothetical protein
MPNINKILNKVSQAKSAVKSLKGIQAKLTGKGYDLKNLASGSLSDVADKLAQQAEEAQATLDKRRSSLEKNKASKQAKQQGKKSPETRVRELQYPIGEELQNYLVFTTLPRTARNADGANNKNLLSSESVEIALYVPDEISEGDVKATYKNEGVGAGIRRGLEIKDSFNGKMDGSTLQATGTALEGAVQDGMNKLGSMLTGGANNFLAGRAANPMEEQMFEGVGFRDFSFEYEFFPRNSDEATAVKDIVWGFKTAMLPDTYGEAEGDTAIENYFNYPNMFKLEWEGPIADKFDDFLPMVCTSCNVSHSNKLFEDGYPISTKMSLSFTEIKILTQENYQTISKSAKKQDLGGGMTSLAERRQETVAASNRDKSANGGGG